MQRAGLTTELPVPTLLFFPDHGLNRLGWQIKPYRTYLPNLQIQTIPGNHWPHLVAPESFNQRLASYINN